jgi:hypothetical protein
MGKKREKGKARKAKAAAAQLAATQEAPLNAGASVRQAMLDPKRWRGWTMVGLTQGCAHGCPALPAPDHAVSLFMDDLWAHAYAQKLPDRLIDTFDNHRQVWDNAILRKLALDILVAIGTDFIMSTDNLNDETIRLAYIINVLEQYIGNGKDGINLANVVVDDIIGGGEREVIRFYLKRISCTCLKAKYSLVKKFHPTRMSGCSICKQVKVRSSMMLCGRCKAVQYCCRECQAANWPSHKGICRSIHEQMKK